MNIRSFTEYEKYTNGSIEDIIGKVHAITQENVNYNSPFANIKSLEEANDFPILICSEFKVTKLNESGKIKSKIYNQFNFRKGYNLINKHIGESFVPKTVKDRNNVKRLKFPIVASGKNGSNTYNSLYMFKKSENDYNSYQEKIVPKTRYEVLMFKNEAVSVYEKINDNRYERNATKDLDKAIKNITGKISESHGLDAYYLTIYESIGGKYYLNKVSKCSSMNEKQANQLYIKIYEDYYGYDLPNWFKNKVRSIDVNS